MTDATPLISGTTTIGQLVPPELLFEQRLKKAAYGLCQARGLNPDQQVADPNNTVLAYRTIPAWQAAEAELRDAHLLAMFVRSLS